MQNEKDYFGHCKKFAYENDFEQVFWKIVDALLEYEVLESNVCLCEIVNE